MGCARTLIMRFWIKTLFLCLTLFVGQRELSAQNVADDDSLMKQVVLPDLLVRAHHRSKPLSYEERLAYWRRIRDVKKTLPYARYVARTVIETYEFAETLPEKERDKHIKRVERELKAEMEPKMRKLTLGQGKILIKLVYRETGSTGYELVSAVLGGWKAFWWNAFARFLGANLKAEYDPKHVEDDAVTERIIELIQEGRL